MKFTVYQNATSFLDGVRCDLERQEAENGLILGVADKVVRQPSPEDGGHYFATVRGSTDGGVLAVVLPPSRPLLFSATASIDEMALVADDLVHKGHSIGEVVAPTEIARTFADLWHSRTAKKAYVAFRMALYLADSIRSQALPAGRLRPAVESDIPCVGGWIAAFQREVFNEDISATAGELARTRIEAGEIFLWDHRHPRAMVGKVRPTRRGISVNAVYTPPESRGRGLASACVSQLTKQLLAEGYSFCTLFADLANPTSNAIYQRIGYRPIAEFSHYRFQ